jgi:hypothetical protein
MGVFAGINSTADNGIVKSVSATKVKAQIMGSPNENISGITFYVNFTLGTVTTYTLTATIINDGVSTTNEYQLPLLNYGSISGLSIALSATGKWIWPIAIPADANVWIVLTATYSGSAPDSTTVVTIDARRDTIHGS